MDGSEATVPIREYFDALRIADQRYNDAVRADDQRALQIKEEADSRALELAREIQTYKDEKANNLRSQIEREGGERATKAEVAALGEKMEAIIKPLADYVQTQQGRLGGKLDTRTVLFSAALSTCRSA
jgi:hypothetical protein